MMIHSLIHLSVNRDSEMRPWMANSALNSQTPCTARPVWNSWS